MLSAILARWESSLYSLESQLVFILVFLSVDSCEYCIELHARFARISRQKEKNDDELGFQTELQETWTSSLEMCTKPKNGVTSKSCIEIYTNKLCSYCDKSGHKFSECRLRKKNDQEKNENANLAKSVERDPGHDNELGFVCREVTKSENIDTMP